ncbi:MAG: insulinase family protein [Bacteroidota bacterium]|nr:insulinase family protein [Bacteroidota bacterium]
MKFFRLLILFIFVSASALFAQQNLNEKLPIDPQVKIGKLSNGLTYYIRQNKKPEQKVELRLVVNAGSVLEDDNEQGLAHLSEHMAFNGTTHFKKNDIVSFLQSIGVGFGNDLNAYTGFDETVYILPIPTDKPSNIEKGFQILEDWAHNVTYKNDDIDGERPVVLEESRLGKGADDRMFRKIYPQMFSGSLYANRLPIGLDSIVRNASYDVVKKFYKDWYRPDLMAVIVVGDIDPAKAESLIKEHFEGLKNPVNERTRISPVVPPYGKDVAEVITDKEATSYSFQVHYSAEKIPTTITLADYKNDLVKEIFSNLLNQRLRELTQKENPPFVYAYAGFNSYARGYEAFNGTIGTGNNDNLAGLTAFEEEVARVKKYGFTKAELDRTKNDMLTSMETAFKEKNKTESENYTEEYIRNFLTQEPIPGIEKENAYYKELLPGITVEDVNAIGKKINKNSNEFIALTGPEVAAGKALPTDAELLAVSSSVDKMDIKPYEEKAISSSLLNKTPKQGKITGIKKNTVLGTTEFTLSNGVSVTLKTTDFKNDQILMSAIRPGGKNNYGENDKYNAEYMIPVVSSMGVGDFSPVDLKKSLAGKTVNVRPEFGPSSEGMNGNSSVKDVESMMQLIYLYFTNPRIDTGLFKSFVQKNKAQLAFLSANPQVVFIDTLFKAMYHNSPLAPIAVPKPEYFDHIDLNRVMQMYKERFGDANEMHFTFVGSINENELKPLLEKYIASLPATSKKFNYVDNKLRTAKGKVDVNVYKGTEQKSLILAVYSGEIPYSAALDLKAQAISAILNIRIIEELREKIQGIYGGGTQAQFEKVPYPNYSFFLQLPCGPEKVDTLLYAANAEIQSLIKNGPSKENLDKVKQQWKEQHKVNFKENGTWLSKLQKFYFPGGNPDYFINYEKYVNALTQKDIQDAAKLLLSTPNVVTGILRPEKK